MLLSFCLVENRGSGILQGIRDRTFPFHSAASRFIPKYSTICFVLFISYVTYAFIYLRLVFIDLLYMLRWSN
jgi:hypothetical protein